MLHDVHSFVIIFIIHGVCVCVCVCVCARARTLFYVNWEVVMVAGKCEQKSCSFQEQTAGKNCSFYCYYHFPLPFCNLSAVSFMEQNILPILFLVLHVCLQSFSANRLED
jgi:hypothetical protein